MTRTLLSTALLAACIAAAPAHAQAPLELVRVSGGALNADPLPHADLVYLPTGRTVSTWAYDDATAPLHLSDSAPASAPITGLARHGDHLYASWRGYDGSGGLAVWSLADPLAPELVHEVDDYTEGLKFPFAVAVANDHLYLFDQDHGVFVADLADPARPELTATDITGIGTAYSRIAVYGDTIQAVGRNFWGMTTLDLYDTSTPLSPLLLANHAVDGIANFSLIPDPDQPVGVGESLTVYDLDEPLMLEPRGTVGIPPALTGARVDDTVYTFGWGSGVDIWDVSDADAPQSVGALDARAFSSRRSAAMDGHLLIATETDLLLALDVGQPQAPAVASTAWLPGGTAAVDAAMHGDNTVLLHQMYGLSVNDPLTLQPIGRFDADLPEVAAERSFEQLAVQDGIAYVALWGYGLINVDLSDPSEPIEVGRVPFPFASVVAVHGDHAYLAKNTNGPLFGVADISDPAAPSLVWQLPLPTRPHQLRVHDGHVYLAESQGADPDSGGSLRVYDIADPAAPVEVAALHSDCGSAFDIAIDPALSLAYLACGGGLQVVDIAQPQAPAVVGRYDVDDHSDYTRVAVQDDRAWFASYRGLHQLDVSDPTAPALIEVTPLGGAAPASLLATGDGHLLALGNTTGIHVFAPGDGDGGDDATPLLPGVPVTGLEGDEGDSLLFSIDVPEGANALQVLSYGGRGDVELLVRQGQPPTADAHDARSDRPGNNQTVRIAAPAAGTWYVRITGNRSFSGVGLQVRL